MGKMKSARKNSSSSLTKETTWLPKTRRLIPVVEILQSPISRASFYDPECVPSSVASTPAELYEEVQKTKRNLRRIDTSSEEEETRNPDTPRRKRLLQKKKLEEDVIEQEEMAHLKRNVILPSRTREKNTAVSKYRTLFEKAKENVHDPGYDMEEALLESDIESFEETTSELDDFIADDESVEEMIQLPDEFSLSKCQDFNTAFQQFVHYLIYQGLNLESLPHDQESLLKDSVVQVEKRLDMYGNSLAISQGWSQEFTDDLKRCPVYVSQHIPSEHTRCTGCMRMRTISVRVNLLGPEYDRRTLALLENDSEFGDPELDLCYTSFEPESIQFEADVPVYLLGRNCHQRSRIFHQLHHFKFQAFQRILQNIKGLGRNLRAASSSEIIKHLEKRNLTTMFLKEFENLIDSAERYCL
ncbi:hypothetical protein K493DRAFT_411992 [Basidiobolus meristosporus CBS 931.73]|uniref:DUF4211 domain-containing protein n=1 Tax=Basidiobolus meristosporus CBS 931.73 TaxID=1314790 RepID=A0A1Y1X7I4_9FUNG|nr:hypothetical protein K493DRAFT_411992 [Basidiobolus meristosporus CBS 931.73]|eukprot:ORX81346.1 hypothetical protein K493DRAFT_411992 [Basidiobolus meristosporus CBS 931.73]